MQNPTALFAELGFAVFERVADRVFKPIGSLPSWWDQIGQLTDNLFVPSSKQAFLQSFLDDSEDLWSQTSESGQLGSAIWELSREEQLLYVQIIARRSDGTNLLIFHNVDTTGEGLRAPLQAGRDSQLELMRDIARRQQLEIELRSAHRASEKLHQARTAFLANVSHELRTPLTSILGMVEMLKEAEVDDQQLKCGSVIERSAHSLLRLVNDVLDMSKYDAGNVELECQELPLARLIEELRNDFSQAAKQKGIEFVAELDESCPPSIWQDPLRLRQVLNNLIDNAIRFTDAGVVSVTIEPDLRQDRMLKCIVADTGMGIPREKHEVIFDSFTQVDASHTREYGGTGLGLAIANKLVGLLGGNLQLESVVGEGSKFTFYVPHRAPQSEKVTVDTSGGSLEAEDGDLAGVTVLIAEDNTVNRRYIRHVVERAQADEVLEADNGQRVLDLLRDHEVDVIVMDCQMPILDGLAATAIIRAAENRVGGHMPIVAVTAHAMKQDVDHCLAVGMDAHLAKPFKPNELRIKIRSALRTKAVSVAGSLGEELLKQHNIG
jgi:signal transduction histidine kinase/ActR/RegA family two-component response regulator